eukprot:9820899-Alexandrium_andersonii.AAC.1
MVGCVSVSQCLCVSVRVCLRAHLWACLCSSAARALARLPASVRVGVRMYVGVLATATTATSAPPRLCAAADAWSAQLALRRPASKSAPA